MFGGGGDSSVLRSSGGGDVAEIAAHDQGGGEGGSNSCEDEKGDRSFGGNRWPRQETLALLKIRSDMDQVFRDSSLKGPLWEDVSRKLSELGYHRSAKKCKEKFENVYKYHKRTKDGRTGKPEGKNYKFFEQLEKLESHHSIPPPKPQTPNRASIAPPTTMPWSTSTTTNPVVPHSTTANMVTTCTNTNPITVHNNNTATATATVTLSTLPTSNPTISTPPLPTTTEHGMLNSCFPNDSTNLFSSSTSSSTASDEEYSHGVVGNSKRKRKWKDFFTRLTKDVMKKQEELQDKFLEAIEKSEEQRIVREEAWKIQEMSRIGREHKILIQERSAAAAKDAAVIAFLQKISSQQQQIQSDHHVNTPQQPPPPATLIAPPAPQFQPRPQSPPITAKFLDSPKPSNGENNIVIMSTPSSRWPKAEVEALIKFRTDLALKYHENGPKGPLWEEISTAMRSAGYNRSSKRCKEKWENINKYFKKVKESNKKRPEDAKTCPYFNQLDALYKEKTKTSTTINPMAPLLVQPEQQWPLQQENHHRHPVDQIQDDEEEEEDGDSYEEEEEYEGGGGGYELVANKQASMGNGE